MQVPQPGGWPQQPQPGVQQPGMPGGQGVGGGGAVAGQPQQQGAPRVTVGLGLEVSDCLRMMPWIGTLTGGWVRSCAGIELEFTGSRAGVSLVRTAERTAK